MFKKFFRLFSAAIFFLSLFFTPLFAYVDPGTGFVFSQAGSFLWALILAALGGFTFFLRFFRKQFFLILFSLILLIIAGMAIRGFFMQKAQTRKKVIILGIDAMDANLTQKLISEGRLPNFSALEKSGGFSPLASSNPSESAVAWTSFMTGLNPGGHGIFDFIMRNPQDYSLYLTLNEVKGLARPQVTNRRKGEAFWQVLSAHKIPAYLYFCPNTFPPEKIYGKMTSGMGVPDITGTMGKFSFYTTKPLTQADKETRGRVVALENGSTWEDYFYGPKIKLNGAVDESKIPLRISKISADEISLQFQGKKIFLKKGRWTPWQRLNFKIGWFKKAYGIVRFYLKNVEPDLELYCSPINFDPENPLFPISYPKDYSRQLAKKVGLFYTQGMPHDTWALSEGRLDENAFLELVDEILKENKAILGEGLKEFKSGLFFYYFESLDVIQHMFWRYIDAKSPLYEKDSRYKDTIYKYYEEIDRILGGILKTTDSDTTLVVMSDHGFGPFRRTVHLNRWLLENGYLFLAGGKKTGGELLEDIDWSKTKAYALGFGGIYINRFGREKSGIITESELGKLKAQIQQGLKKWVDPAAGENVIKEVYDADDIFSGAYKANGPELFVGFNFGYRASWQTALGAVPAALIEDNKKKWSGDHLIDPSLVPGVIFTNKKIEFNNPNIADIGSIILGMFGLSGK